MIERRRLPSPWRGRSRSLALPAATMAQDGAGGTLVAAIGAEPDQLDPHVTSSYNSFQVLENVVDTLVEPDENLEMVPALAESWEVSDDGLVYTFDLRDGVTWHDGTPLTADDVVYSYGRWATNNGWRFAPETEVTAPDADTVVFTLPAPAPNLLSNLGAYKGLAIVQQANVESGDIATAPIGTGPFKMGAWNSGDSIEIVRNDDYWGDDRAARRRDLSASCPIPRSRSPTSRPARPTGPATCRRSRSAASWTARTSWSRPCPATTTGTTP